MREHERSLSHEDREMIRRLMALTLDLATSVRLLSSSVDNLSVRIGGTTPPTGFSVPDTDIQAAIKTIDSQTARLDAMLKGSPGHPNVPQISGVSPTSGPIGTQVTIQGSGFIMTQGSSTVKFSDALAVASSWSDTQIVVTVPPGALTGNLVVTVNGEEAPFPFTVS